MVDISFLGGCRKIGDLGLLLDNGKQKVVFEYGANIQTNEMPMQPDMPIHGVFVSHAHLDHSGNVPELYKMGYKGPVWATHVTHDLMALLLRDSIKVQTKRGQEPSFYINHVLRMERMRQAMRYGEAAELDTCSVEFHNAGHIPGASALLYESQGKRILFTGDTKFEETTLVKGAETDYKDIDLLITETTYSYKNHPSRAELAERLRETIQETIYNNGIALIPSFAVGRTQEMLTLVYDLGFPVYVDGMGIEATKRMLDYPSSLSRPKKLRAAFQKAHIVRKRADRSKLVKNPCIIICTAGMLQGGPVSYYMQKLHDKENCTLVMNGYQVEGTVGRILMETGEYVTEEFRTRPKMRMEVMDFSAHCGRDNLLKFIKKVNPQKLGLVHGERTVEFSEELKGMGFDTIAPEKGDKVSI